jgi:hypothetical protein
MLRAGAARGPQPDDDARVVAAELIAEAYRWIPGRPVGNARAVRALVARPGRAERARRWVVHPWAMAVSMACGTAGFVLYQGTGFGLYHALQFVPFLPQIDPVGTVGALIVAAGVGASAHVTGVLVGLTLDHPRHPHNAERQRSPRQGRAPRPGGRRRATRP